MPEIQQNPSAMVVTCVEAGYLESQTIRMIESLRNWGGRLANVPVVAVTPRLGPPLQASTIARYQELRVKHLRCKSTSKYAWYNFMNKPTALLAAEREAAVDSMIWFDADLLIVDEPTDLLLTAGEDFTACPTEKNVGTTGSADPYQPYWIAMCEAIGIDLEELPWVDEFRSNESIRMYFNGGVFSYRPASGYAKAYLDVTERMLNGRFKLAKDGIFYHEQAAVGLAAAKQKVRWRILPERFNYHLGSMTLEHVVAEKFRSASILHYHRSMQPDRWEHFLPLIEENHPKVMPWLKPKGPLNFKLSRWNRVVSKALRVWRKRQSGRYLESCRTVQ